VAPVREATVTGPAEVSMALSLYCTTQSAEVFSSGCTASHNFFF
jgi:hypothetical protein